jgi:hypothetical protein
MFKLVLSESGAEYASDAAEYFDINISSDTINGKYLIYILTILYKFFNNCSFLLIHK